MVALSRSRLLGLILLPWLALSGCSHPGPAPAKDYTDPFFESKDDGIINDSHLGPDGTENRTCIGAAHPDAPPALRGKCWIRTCKRQGNQETCQDNHAQDVIDWVNAQDQIKQTQRDQQLAALEKPCFAGDLAACARWTEDAADAKVPGFLKRLCRSPIYSCEWTNEKLHVVEASLRPSCSLQLTPSETASGITPSAHCDWQDGKRYRSLRVKKR